MSNDPADKPNSKESVIDNVDSVAKYIFCLYSEPGEQRNQLVTKLMEQFIWEKLVTQPEHYKKQSVDVSGAKKEVLDGFKFMCQSLGLDCGEELSKMILREVPEVQDGNGNPAMGFRSHLDDEMIDDANNNFNSYADIKQARKEQLAKVLPSYNYPA